VIRVELPFLELLDLTHPLLLSGHPAQQTWRSMQYCLTGIGALVFLLVFFWLPETWHGETPHAKACRERGKRFVMYWFNPLSSVALLRWPNVATIVSRHVVGGTLANR
jgi:hypothetical protein